LAKPATAKYSNATQLNALRVRNDHCGEEAL
jgi:hypothetical protein